MGEFLHKYNTDNVHSRAVIVGFVNLLNSKIFFENVLSDTNVDVVYVPFFYNMGGDERFLQDYFLEWNDCVHPRHADGNYDVIPRGIVTMSSKSVDSAKLTHRFVRGNYIKEVGGQLQTFSAYLNSLPIAMTFDIEIEVDSNLDAFKVEQALLETFYKNQVFSVTYKGHRIPCQAGFAEEYGVEKTFEFSYQANQKIMVKFNVQVETYFPVMDPTSERSNSNRMTQINTVDISQEVYNKPRITFTSPTHNEKFFSSGVLPISWTNTGPIMRVNIYYRLVGSGTTGWTKIASSVPNSGSFDWSVPFFNSTGAEISIAPQKAMVITTQGSGAEVRPIIDPTGVVTDIIILKQGFGYTLGTDMIEVNLYPMPTVIPAGYTQPVIQANTTEGNVIGATIVNPGVGFVPSPLTQIEFKIEDASNDLIYQVLDTEVQFTGDINPTLPAPGNTRITNLIPTVTNLQLEAPLIGQTVSGIGIPTGSKITAVNPILNYVDIDNATTTLAVGTELTLSVSTAQIYIQ